MTNPNYTHISVVVDRSGSMSSVRTDAEGGLRSFLDEQFAEPGKLTVSVAQFDTAYEEVARMATSDPLGSWSLQPRGMTALLDAMGRAITSTGEDLAKMDEDERPGKVFFVVVTDGMENSSREWKREKVFDAVKRQTDQYGWNFVYTAANQDAIAVGNDLGFAHSMNHAATGQGNRAAYATVSSSISRSRSGDAFSVPENA